MIDITFYEEANYNRTKASTEIAHRAEQIDRQQ